jgi:hypothetical protein
MGRGESVIKLLFEAGHLYHRTILNPLYEVFRQEWMITIFCRTFILLTLISEASSTRFDFVALDKISIAFVVPSASLQHPDGASLLDEDPRHFLEGAAPR